MQGRIFFNKLCHQSDNIIYKASLPVGDDIVYEDKSWKGEGRGGRGEGSVTAVCAVMPIRFVRPLLDLHSLTA